MLIEGENYGRAVREYWRQYDDRLKMHPDDEADRLRVRAERAALKRRHTVERWQQANDLDYRRLPKAEREARAAELEIRHRAELRVLDDRRGAMLGDMTAGLIELEIGVGRPLPLPRVFIGQRPTWPVPRDADGACGACHGRPLRRLEVCLVCHRSGIDDLLSPPPPMTRPKPATVAEKIVIQGKLAPKAEASRVAGGTGPASKPTSALWDRALRDLQALRGKRSAAAGLNGGVG